MDRDPLLTTLLDLDAALQNRQLIVGGGYGLFLKQLYLQEHDDIQTLFPHSTPQARTTEDIDVIFRAEVVTDSNAMKEIRAALDTLGFQPVESAKYTQFTKELRPGRVKIDLLAAPLAEFASRVPKDARRVKPRPSVQLHASKLEEALAVDRDALSVPISGTLSTGAQHQTTVLIPQGFSYLLMKLHAFRDRMDDEDRELGRHHALDVYRIVGLITKQEYDDVTRLASEFVSHPIVGEASRIAREHFIDPDGRGQLRIREHALFSDAFAIEKFAEELASLFP